MSRKALVISWAFPPILDTESLQTLRCVKCLPQHGWQPLVLTVKTPHRTCAIDPSLMRLVPSDLRVERAWTWEHRLTIGLLRRFAPSLLELPDKERGWLWGGVWKGGATIKREGPAVLYSRACPWTDHLIAHHLKGRTGVPWVAHFSDPWTDSPYFQPRSQRHRRFHEKWERRVVESADALTFATPLILDQFARKYDGVAPKCFVVSNCFDRAELRYAVSPSAPPRFTFTHVGKFYGARSPAPLLRGLGAAAERCSKLRGGARVQFVGSLAPEHQRLVRDLGLADMVTVTGFVPYFHSLGYEAASDVLVSIDAPCDGASPFLPSKLLEYLAAGKPILGITPARGLSAALIAQGGGVVVEPSDTDGIAAAILSLWRSRHAVRLPPHGGCANAYDVAQTSAALANVLSRVAG